MKFHYIASMANGKLTEGNTEANNTAELLTTLASRGLKPVSVKPLKNQDVGHAARHFFGQSITIADKIFLTKYLAIMLRVGTDLFQAINILIADFEKPSLRALLIEIREALERGQPFYTTFAKYPQYFSPVFVSLVKAGEASGNLEGVFENLSLTLEKEKELRGKIRAALTYPIILLVLSLVILIFLTTFALPKLSGVFSTGGFKPPTFSRVVFAVGLFIHEYILIFLGFLAAGIVSLIIFSRTIAGKRLISQFINRLPVIKKISYRLAIQRFATTLSALIKAGVPIIDALTITANTVSHAEMRAALLRVANEGLSQGLTLGDAFKRESVFPFVVVNLIAISEKTGHIDEILDTLGRFYESEIDTGIKNAITFIEPILLLFIGGIIGLVALAIIIPVYQLVGQI